MSTCTKDNLELCGDPPLSLSFSPEVMCKEGSLTIFLALVTLVIIVLARYFISHWPGAGGIRRGIAGNNAGVISKTLERVLITPFVPNSVETFISLYTFFWFLLTIPMAITRHYENRWALQMFTQHGPLNFLSQSLGCASIDLTATNYTHSFDETHQPKERTLSSILKPKPNVGDRLEEDHFEKIDLLFTLHLTFGLLWLTFGFLQIWLARTGWSVSINVLKLFL